MALDENPGNNLAHITKLEEELKFVRCRLKAAEREICYLEGRCFYCKEIGHTVHSCARKKAADAHRARQAFQTEESMTEEWIRKLVNEKNALNLHSMGDQKSLLVPAKLLSAQNSAVTLTTLIDCGCTAFGFIDNQIARDHDLPRYSLPKPRVVYLADGKTAGQITEYVVTPMAIGSHEELTFFFVTTLGPDNPAILGIPWLQRHNPLIEWASLELMFCSQFCHNNCLPIGSTRFVLAPKPAPKPEARRYEHPQPTVKDCCLEVLEEKVPASRLPSNWATIQRETRPPAKSNYRQPFVEDEPDDEPSAQEGHTLLEIPQTLTPGQPHYRTYAKPRDGPETRAMMIPNQPKTKPLPVGSVAGQRRPSPRPQRQPLPPLSVPIPVNNEFEFCSESIRPDLARIRMANAVGFAQFCRNPAVRAMTITWEELDRLGDELDHLDSDHLRRIQEKDANLRHSLGDSPSFRGETLNRVSDDDVGKFLKGKPIPTPAEIVQRLPEWLRDLADAFLPQLADKLPPHRTWDHKIELMPGKEPPYNKNRPLSIQELRVVRKWLEDNLAKGFIRESRARCAAPLMLAAKPGGGVRICQDYRGLNNITIKNRYPLPLVRETLDAICHAKFYTKLDIIAAFNKLRVAEGHEWKTAFTTRFGLYESLVMPFGLCNAPATFQHYINHTLHDLLDRICTAYLDDVLVYSATRKEHREHVRTVVTRLRAAGLQIDINKCEFETTRTKYLGLMITPDGIEMDPEKVKAIVSWRAPTSVRDLQRFLGFSNFYRRFIRGFSTIARPLYDLLKKGTSWDWTSSQQEAFNTLRQSFTTAPTLAFFDYNRRTLLETDASDWASGGVLSQYDDNNVLRPVAYFSSKHSAAECNYEIYDKELLAIIKCLEEWRPELQGTQKPFEVLTDHKNLQFFMTTKALNQRQVRWSEFLSRFNFQITYRPGARAIRPDALSRRREDRPAGEDDDDRLKHRKRVMLPYNRFDTAALEHLLNEGGESLAQVLLLPATDRPIDELIDEAYATDMLSQAMITCLQDPTSRQWSPSVRDAGLRIAFGDCKVVGKRVYYRDRLFVPPNSELRTQVIYRAHSSGPGGHPGRTKTVDLLNRTYWWPRMSKEVRAYVKACELCIRTKTPRTAPPGFLQPLPVPFRPWSDISVDYITPLPNCKYRGTTFKHLLVVVCRLTKMRHFIPVPSLDTEDLVDAFVARVYCLHGTPDNIVSDRGTQFVSQFWRELSARLDVTLKPSSAFHPESDGQTERINSSVEQYLRTFVNFHQDDWVRWLPLAEFAGNNVVSETTGVSPFFANYGFNPQMGVEPRPPCSPTLTDAQRQEFYRANEVADRFSQILERLQALARQAQQRYEDNANVRRSDAPQFREGDLVYVSTQNMKTNRPIKKLDDKWAGPFEVLQCYPRACRIKLPPGVRIFPVFHTSLLQRKSTAGGLPGQDEINEAESKNVRGRVLERDDAGVEVEKWEFSDILDAHDEAGPGQITYKIKWRHQKPSWQPAEDLRGQEEALQRFHDRFPHKPGPPQWLARKHTESAEQPEETIPGQDDNLVTVPANGQAIIPAALAPTRSGRTRKAPNRLVEKLSHDADEERA